MKNRNIFLTFIICLFIVAWIGFYVGYNQQKEDLTYVDIIKIEEVFWHLEKSYIGF